MTLSLHEIISELENWAPASLQEGYDNSGLQVGQPNQKIERALVSLDITEEVLDEALERNCQLIIAHHPLIFKPLKKITEGNEVERIVRKAIQNNIALYAIHTNLDNIQSGVNKIIGDKLELQNLQILAPGKSDLYKLVTFVPKDHAEKVAQSLFQAGAGKIGGYDSCSFQLEGEGTFRAGEDSNPFVGKKGEIHREKEMRIETILPAYRKNAIIQSLLKAHPYEEVAYDLYPLKNTDPTTGAGMLGNLPKAIPTADFLASVRQKLDVEALQFSKKMPKTVQKIAFCGGSGSFLIERAMQAKADVFITGDVKYHDFFHASEDFMIINAGHWETEHFTPEGIIAHITEKLPNFALLLSTVNTNPSQWLRN